MINIVEIDKNKWQILDVDYGYSYCEITFDSQPLERGEITEDDQMGICQNIVISIKNVLSGKE